MKKASDAHDASEARFVACCGAYCKTCRSFVLGSCRACKVGYDDEERRISRARCRVKACCLGVMKLETCAGCNEYDSCVILAAFHDKRVAEYGKYRESLEFIRANGYAEFCKRAKDWRRAYGELRPRPRKRQ